MLTETFIAATEAVNKPSAHLSSALKDVGVFHYEFQPQNILRHGYKKTSVKPNCLAVSSTHIFAAQAGKAVIHAYNREKTNQEATVPFPEKIHSLAYAQESALLVIGTEDGKLVLWEVATGRIKASAASHLEPVSSLSVTPNNDYIVSGSADSSIHIWSLLQLLSFSSHSESYNDNAAKDVPLRSFSHHRSGVTALVSGHSKTSTNFVISASEDRTCYLWHIETCQILRTFLTPAVTISLTLDPADRAIYLGNDDGTIQSIDLFGTSSKNPKQSLYDTIDAAPIQVKAEHSWSAAASDLGAVNCITLSYDGTTLLSGHVEGTINRWDVAKHRIVSEIANLHQSVSYIEMITPEGLRHEDHAYTIPTIVKPRLELNAEMTESTVNMPASYSLTAQIVQGAPLSGTSDDIDAVLSGGLFPDFMLDEATQAMTAMSAGIPNSTSSSTATANKSDTYKIQILEEEKAALHRKLAVMQKLHEDSQERHRRRSEQREKLGQQRRDAYFAAKKKGKNGDEAMRPFDKKLEAIDVQSDEDELQIGDQMDVDG